MKYQIIKDNNAIMRERSKEVSLPLEQIDKDMLNWMSQYLKKSQDEDYAKKHNIRAGVGLAAIQLGVLKRMFVVYFDDGNDNLYNYQLVNPKIIETSLKKCALEGGEGCLSVNQEHNGLVHRYYKITIKGFDAISEKEVTLTLTGYPAIVFQHEYDHLEGTFFYDRINKLNPMQPLLGEEII